MPGLFDGMRISTSGINAGRKQQEVIGQNIANASNENYTRQELRLTTASAVYDGQHFLGQGVHVAKVMRIRDELLDNQLRHSSALQARYETELEWLKKVEAAYDEPSEHGISTALSNFWESWAELSNDPESFASRSQIISRTEHLATTINNLDTRLSDFIDDLDQAIVREAQEINVITADIAHLNKEIFNLEAGRDAAANDLRDTRDAAIDRLAAKVDIRHFEDPNGMMHVFVSGHPVVMGDSAERLLTRTNPLDSSEVELKWEYGERWKDSENGSLAGILNVRDTIIPSVRAELDSFVGGLIEEVNAIYSNGAGLEPDTLLQSRLGYEALGVDSSTESLNLIETGEYGSIHMSFYDDEGNLVRSNGILIEADDSLQDIADKLDAIAGVDAAIISDTNQDGRLRLRLDTLSGENVMGESSFTVSNHTDGFDSSGFLSLLGFDQTAKSSNSSSTAPTLSSRDLSELQTILGEGSVSDVRNHVLGLSGTFTINAFETGTESGSKTNGTHVQQLAIEVVSTDSIDDIIAKINALTATHGISAAFNSSTNTVDITSSARTDASGGIQLSGGSDYLRLSFANTYRYPTVIDDEPPAHHTGRGDTTGLLGKLQFNTLFQGSDASDIGLDSHLTSANDIHAGFERVDGDNSLALALSELQHARLTGGNQFTLNEQYENHLSEIGTQVQRTTHLESNEAVLLQSYQSEKDSVSGVNLDEELSKMIQFQRAYEANARMLSTFNQMVSELLNLIN